VRRDAGTHTYHAAHKQLTCNTRYTCAVVAQQRHLGTAARNLHRQLKVDLR
jgi:hypothetical protein